MYADGGIQVGLSGTQLHGRGKALRHFTGIGPQVMEAEDPVLQSFTIANICEQRRYSVACTKPCIDPPMPCLDTSRRVVFSKSNITQAGLTTSPSQHAAAGPLARIARLVPTKGFLQFFPSCHVRPFAMAPFHLFSAYDNVGSKHLCTTSCGGVDGSIEQFPILTHPFGSQADNFDVAHVRPSLRKSPLQGCEVCMKNLRETVNRSLRRHKIDAALEKKK